MMICCLAVAWDASDKNVREHLAEFDSQYAMRVPSRELYYPRQTIVMVVEEFADDDRCWGEQVIGLCCGVTHNTVLVRFRESWWLRASRWEREQLAMHELGHCILGRDHDDAMRGKLPASIMNSELTMEDDEYNGDTREPWLTELFKFQSHDDAQACFY